MARITKMSSGKYQAQISVQGVRKSATFKLKKQAEEWATAEHFMLDQSRMGVSGRLNEYTIMSIFMRWKEEVLPTRNGKKWDAIKLRHIMEWKGWNVRIIENLQYPMKQFRDHRLKTISNNSCNRELNLISCIFTHAQKEWDLGNFINPVKLIKRPPYDDKPRKERWSNAEVKKIYDSVDFKYGDTPTKVQDYICYALSLGVETAMRVGEICKIEKQHYFRDDGYVFLPMTKNGEEREVPLTNKAIEILDILSEGLGDRDLLMRGQNTDRLGANFRKMKMKVGLAHKHFHDSRHEAATRLSRVFTNTLELSAVTGHKRLDMLKRYYNPTGKEMRERLANL